MGSPGPKILNKYRVDFFLLNVSMCFKLMEISMCHFVLGSLFFAERLKNLTGCGDNITLLVKQFLFISAYISQVSFF